VLFGPGSIDVAHKPNEWLPRDEFDRAAGMLRQVVERFCGEAA
jgi:acetylornithine deacetylase